MRRKLDMVATVLFAVAGSLAVLIIWNLDSDQLSEKFIAAWTTLLCGVMLHYVAKWFGRRQKRNRVLWKPDAMRKWQN